MVVIHRFRWKRVVVFTAILLSIQSLGPARPIGWRYNGNPRDLLSAMQQCRTRLKTLECTVTYDDFQSWESWAKTIESMTHLPGGFGELPQETIPNTIRPGATRHTYQTQRIVYHIDGRTRIELTRGIYDRFDRRVPIPEKSCSLWDGRTSIDYLERPGVAPPTAILGETRSILFDVLRSPLRSFGGQFLEAFSQAIRDGGRIDIEQDGVDGTVRIAFSGGGMFLPGDVNSVAVVDPSQGFSVLDIQQFREDAIFARFRAEFIECAGGVWFPHKGTIESYLPDGQLQMLSRVAVGGIKVNNPDFDADAFHFVLPKGTRVVRRSGNAPTVIGSE